MASPRPGDAPPPYSATTPPPVGFQGVPTMKVDAHQQAPGGYGPPPQQYGQQYGQPSTQYYTQTQPGSSVHVVTTQPHIATQPVVVVSSATCPNCRAGILQNEFTCCGICLAICFFPLGILCCFLMMERRCNNCRMSFGGGI